MKLLQKEFDRQIIKFFKKIYRVNSQKKIYKDFIFDQITQIGWHGFIPATYSHVKDWREYYYKNLSEIDNLFVQLFENLDEKSKMLGKLLFQRNIEFLPIKNNQTFLMMDLNQLFTEEELSEQNRLLKIKTDYKLANDEKVSTYIEAYNHGFIFIEDIAVEYVRNKDFIDAGAYIGDSALVLNKLEPNRIFSFEPEDKNYNLLKQTIYINNLENKIIPISKGLSDKDKSYSFDGSDTSGKITNSNTENSINVTYIDKFVEENNLNPSLIKLDIEGAEYDAIIGAKETIQKFKPILLISIYHTAKDFFEIKPMIEKIANYKFLIRATRPEMLNTEFMLICYPKELENAK